MKAVKIPTTEKELKKFLDDFVQYAQKRGVRVYSILAYSPMVESGVSLYPALAPMVRYDAADCERFVSLWFDATDSLKKQMAEMLEKHKGGKQ